MDISLFNHYCDTNLKSRFKNMLIKLLKNENLDYSEEEKCEAIAVEEEELATFF